jgi:hypothetical protein
VGQELLERNRKEGGEESPYITQPIPTEL